MIATDTVRHFAPTPAFDLNVDARILAAYAAAGVAEPDAGAAIYEQLRTEPTASDVAQQLAHEVYESKDPKAFVKQAVVRLEQARTPDALRDAMMSHRSRVAVQRQPQRIADVVTAIRHDFDHTAKALTEAAKELPDGNDCLDLEAIVDADSTRAMREAHEALAKLSIYQAIHGVILGTEVDPLIAQVTSIVHFHEVPIEQVDRMHDGPLNPNDRRQAVRDFSHTARKNGMDVALVRLARGEFLDLNMQLAADTTAHRDNHDRAFTAFRRTHADRVAAPATRVNA